MPAVIEKTYSHRAHYTTGELSLKPRQKKEQRFMPGAYAPKSVTIHIKTDEARFEIEYSVKETPGYNVQIAEGVRGVYGKFTKKVLGLTFEYPTLDILIDQMAEAAKIIRSQQKNIPQDSIKRNYQIATDLLLFVQEHVKKDLNMLKDTLNKISADTPTSV
jgi:hypothetical protein